MKRGLPAALLFVLALFLLPASASAYSYGDANTEDVAETFKLVQSNLSNGANDWSAAEEAYKVRRAEIASHFGEEVAATLDNNIQAKDSKAVIANFKAVLVMNLDRRFTYTLKDLDDYAQAKLLLAKAKATFDALAPCAGSASGDINKAFDAALDALGNPGLFGVGKKEAQPDVFKEKVDFIYKKVNPLFPYTAASAKKPAPSEPAVAAKPQETQKASEAVKNEAAPSQQPAAGKGQDAKPAESQQPDPALAANEQKAADEPSASASASPTPTAEAAQPAASAETAVKAEETPNGGQEKQTDSVKEAAAHAPMQRSDKTNPIVSIVIIGAVIVVLGGGVWLARKRKWI